jgi:excisionase family DNA binding protein
MYYIVYLLGNGVAKSSPSCDPCAGRSWLAIMGGGCSGGVMPAERGGLDGVRLLNVREAARYLGTTPKTLYTMAWRRDIIFVKIGRSLRFDLRELERLVEKSKVRPREDQSW